MQVGIRLHDIAPGTLEQRVAMAHEQGFTCGHLALAKTVTEHSVENTALTPGYATYLRQMFAKNDVDIAVIGCYLNLAHPDQMCIRDSWRILSNRERSTPCRGRESRSF